MQSSSSIPRTLSHLDSLLPVLRISAIEFERLHQKMIELKPLNETWEFWCLDELIFTNEAVKIISSRAIEVEVQWHRVYAILSGGWKVNVLDILTSICMFMKATWNEKLKYLYDWFKALDAEFIDEEEHFLLLRGVARCLRKHRLLGTLDLGDDDIQFLALEARVVQERPESPEFRFGLTFDQFVHWFFHCQHIQIILKFASVLRKLLDMLETLDLRSEALLQIMQLKTESMRVDLPQLVEKKWTESNDLFVTVLKESSITLTVPARYINSSIYHVIYVKVSRRIYLEGEHHKVPSNIIDRNKLLHDHVHLDGMECCKKYYLESSIRKVDLSELVISPHLVSVIICDLVVNAEYELTLYIDSIKFRTVAAKIPSKQNNHTLYILPATLQGKAQRKRVRTMLKSHPQSLTIATGSVCDSFSAMQKVFRSINFCSSDALIAQRIDDMLSTQLHVLHHSQLEKNSLALFQNVYSNVNQPSSLPQYSISSGRRLSYFCGSDPITDFDWKNLSVVSKLSEKVKRRIQQALTDIQYDHVKALQAENSIYRGAGYTLLMINQQQKPSLADAMLTMNQSIQLFNDFGNSLDRKQQPETLLLLVKSPLSIAIEEDISQSSFKEVEIKQQQPIFGRFELVHGEHTTSQPTINKADTSFAGSGLKSFVLKAFDFIRASNGRQNSVYVISCNWIGGNNFTITERKPGFVDANIHFINLCACESMLDNDNGAGSRSPKKGKAATPKKSRKEQLSPITEQIKSLLPENAYIKMEEDTLTHMFVFDPEQVVPVSFEAIKLTKQSSRTSQVTPLTVLTMRVTHTSTSSMQCELTSIGTGMLTATIYNIPIGVTISDFNNMVINTRQILVKSATIQRKFVDSLGTCFTSFYFDCLPGSKYGLVVDTKSGGEVVSKVAVFNTQYSINTSKSILFTPYVSTIDNMHHTMIKNITEQFRYSHHHVIALPDYSNLTPTQVTGLSLDTVNMTNIKSNSLQSRNAYLDKVAGSAAVMPFQAPIKGVHILFQGTFCVITPKSDSFDSLSDTTAFIEGSLLYDHQEVTALVVFTSRQLVEALRPQPNNTYVSETMHPIAHELTKNLLEALMIWRFDRLGRSVRIISTGQVQRPINILFFRPELTAKPMLVQQEQLAVVEEDEEPAVTAGVVLENSMLSTHHSMVKREGIFMTVFPSSEVIEHIEEEEEEIEAEEEQDDEVSVAVDEQAESVVLLTEPAATTTAVLLGQPDSVIVTAALDPPAIASEVSESAALTADPLLSPAVTTVEDPNTNSNSNNIFDLHIITSPPPPPQVPANKDDESSVVSTSKPIPLIIFPHGLVIISNEVAYEVYHHHTPSVTNFNTTIAQTHQEWYNDKLTAFTSLPQVYTLDMIVSDNLLIQDQPLDIDFMASYASQSQYLHNTTESYRHTGFWLNIQRTICPADSFKLLLGPIIGKVTEKEARILFEVNMNITRFIVHLQPTNIDASSDNSVLLSPENSPNKETETDTKTETPTKTGIIAVTRTDATAYEPFVLTFPELQVNTKYEIFLPEIYPDRLMGSFRTLPIQGTCTEIIFTAKNAFHGLPIMHDLVEEVKQHQVPNLDRLHVLNQMKYNYNTEEIDAIHSPSITASTWHYLTESLRTPGSGTTAVFHLHAMSPLTACWTQFREALFIHCSKLNFERSDSNIFNNFTFQQLEHVIRDTFRVVYASPAVAAAFASCAHLPLYHADYLLPDLADRLALLLENKTNSKISTEVSYTSIIRKLFERQVQLYINPLFGMDNNETAKDNFRFWRQHAVVVALVDNVTNRTSSAQPQAAAENKEEEEKTVKSVFQPSFIDKSQWKKLRKFANDNTILHLVMAFEQPLIPLSSVPSVASGSNNNVGLIVATGDTIPWAPNHQDLEIFFQFWFDWMIQTKQESFGEESKSILFVSCSDVPYVTLIQDLRSGFKLYQLCVGAYDLQGAKQPQQETKAEMVINGKIGRFRYIHQFQNMDNYRTEPSGLDALRRSSNSSSGSSSNKNVNGLNQLLSSLGDNVGFAKLKLYSDTWNPITAWCNGNLSDIKAKTKGEGDANLVIGPIVGAPCADTQTTTASAKHPESDEHKSVDIFVPVMFEIDRKAIVSWLVTAAFADHKFTINLGEVTPFKPVIIRVGPLQPDERYTVKFNQGIKASQYNEFVLSTHMNWDETNVAIVNCDSPSTTDNAMNASLLLTDLRRRTQVPFNGINAVILTNFEPNCSDLLQEFQHSRVLLEGLSIFYKTNMIHDDLRREVTSILAIFRERFREIYSGPSLRDLLKNTMNILVPKARFADDTELIQDEESRPSRVLRLLQLIQCRVEQEYIDQFRHPSVPNIYRFVVSYIVDGDSPLPTQSLPKINHIKYELTSQNLDENSSLLGTKSLDSLSHDEGDGHEQSFLSDVQNAYKHEIKSEFMEFIESDIQPVSSDIIRHRILWCDPLEDTVDSILKSWLRGARYAATTFMPYLSLNRKLSVELINGITKTHMRRIDRQVMRYNLHDAFFRVMVIHNHELLDDSAEALLTSTMEQTVSFAKAIHSWQQDYPLHELCIVAPCRRYGSLIMETTNIQLENDIKFTLKVHFLDSIFRSNEYDRRYKIALKEKNMPKKKLTNAAAKSKRAQKKKEDEERLQKESIRAEVKAMIAEQLPDGYLLLCCHAVLIITPNEEHEKDDIVTLHATYEGDQGAQIMAAEEQGLPIDNILNAKYRLMQLPNWMIQFVPANGSLFVLDEVILNMRQTPALKPVLDRLESNDLLGAFITRYESSRLSELSRPEDLREVDMDGDGVIPFFFRDILQSAWQEDLPQEMKDAMFPWTDAMIRGYCSAWSFRSAADRGEPSASAKGGDFNMDILSSAPLFAKALQKFAIYSIMLKAAYQLSLAPQYRYLLDRDEVALQKVLAVEDQERRASEARVAFFAEKKARQNIEKLIQRIRNQGSAEEVQKQKIAKAAAARKANAKSVRINAGGALVDERSSHQSQEVVEEEVEMTEAEKKAEEAAIQALIDKRQLPPDYESDLEDLLEEARRAATGMFSESGEALSQESLDDGEALIAQEREDRRQQLSSSRKQQLTPRLGDGRDSTKAATNSANDKDDEEEDEGEGEINQLRMLKLQKERAELDHNVLEKVVEDVYELDIIEAVTAITAQLVFEHTQVERIALSEEARGTLARLHVDRLQEERVQVRRFFGPRFMHFS